MKILKVIIISITFSLFINSCEELNDCKCEPVEKDWTSEMQIIEPGINGILTGYYKNECSFIVYEEFVETPDKGYLICCMWPPKDLPWSISKPLSWPEPTNSLWKFKMEPPSEFSENLLSAISSAPHVIIVNIPLSLPYGSDIWDNKIGVQFSYGKSNYIGSIDFWQFPYTEQPFSKFLQGVSKKQFQYNWEKLPVEFLVNLADESGFSTNSIGKKELPTYCSFAGFALWDSGLLEYPPSNGEEEKDAKDKVKERKFPWAKIACIAATGLSDIGSVAATGAVGAANVLILKVEETK